MRGAVIVALCVACVAVAHAETRAKTTTLSLARTKAKPARLLVKKIEAEVVGTTVPCSLRLVITPQHTLFKRFSIDVPFPTKTKRAPASLEVEVVGTEDPISTRRGSVELVKRAGHDFDAKLDTTFDHGASTWTLTGVVRVENASCASYSSTK